MKKYYLSIMILLLSGGLLIYIYRDRFISTGKVANFKNIGVQELNEMLVHKDFTLIDVHIPEQKHIKGTDDFIPFDAIRENKDKLPPENEKIILYCRTGRMSVLAAKELVEMGYTDVSNLDGGIESWEETGFPVDGADRIIYLYAKRFEFSPDLIKVRQNERIKIIAQSLDVPHGFALGEINKHIEPGKKTVIEFGADKKGEFDFICSVNCGPGHNNMKGKLIVE